MTECVAQIVERTLQKRPMVHSITNNVTVNDCANIILAAGGSAIMAQDEREVAEITSRSDALSLNMGALRAQEAMLLSAHAAIPWLRGRADCGGKCVPACWRLGWFLWCEATRPRCGR